MITKVAEWFETNRQKLAQIVACILTPLFYVASLPPYGVNEAAFVFLVPFGIWLSFGPSLKAVFLTSFGIGWSSWIVLIFWLHHVTWGGMIALAGIVGLHFSFWAIGVSWLSKRASGEGMWRGLAPSLGAAALWVMVEHLRTYIFTGFPWLPLSASQVNEPIMLQSASIFGSWVVSFALVLLNFGIAAYLIRLVEYARTKKRGVCPEFYLALSFTVAISFMLLRLSSGQQREKAFRAAVIQPNVPQNQKWDLAFERKIIGELERQTLAMKALDPDAAFWPETVLPYPLNDAGPMEAWSARLATGLEAPIFAGAMGVEGESGNLDWYNSVFLVRPEYGLFPLYYSKQHLVPFGEYIPLRALWPWMEKVVPINGDILPGEKSQLLPLDLEDRTLRVGSLVCFEDVFPSLARDAVKEGAGFLYVATNSAWYGKSGAASQHKAHSVLRAIETRRPVLRVGNDGWTGWIDEYGSVKGSLDPWEQSATVFEISRDRRWVGKQTFYVTYGDWFVWMCWAVFGLSAWAAPRLVDKKTVTY
ncbi:apolipoprotein N-acyltransferase [Pelagicoccus sp. SDUM812002]|uniref:apolipoprotein N-acyltransferase n=1 Tax=Pelagicoccus sp. SDUM812002 TaxID=3041266 RepID=UPI00280FF0D4|nr:apolipoprotein N-acyltransferase [Pelagicoccus sp. SDUM812002]MDQ8187280.1 apolipoprotein N-acyltransferase [Pelagicoccus sp. SDUM812002]